MRESAAPTVVRPHAARPDTVRTPLRSSDGHGWREFLEPRKAEVVCVILLCLIVTLTWCGHYNRWSRDAWRTPINYVETVPWDLVPPRDGLWGMSVAKAMADGEMWPLLPKYPKSLGAPFGANWNDWPTFEEGINAWWALLAKAFGVFAGSNLAVLCAHLLAGITFFAVCRSRNYKLEYSFLGATLFALSRYAFSRNLPHVSLTYYWHIPLGLIVLWWCIQDRSILSDRRKLLFAYLVAVVHGVQNPYFSGMFLQLLGWAAVYSFARKRDWRAAAAPVSVAAVAVVTLGIVNLDTFYSWYVNGPNLGAAVRYYFDLEWYALRPIELLLPRSHAITALGAWANKVFFTVNVEGGSPYIGIVGILAALAVAWATFRGIAQRDLREIPPHFWCICLIGAFCVVGGFSGMAGLFGFQLFRCTNRYSIVILAILLLFLVRHLSRVTTRWSAGARYGLTGVLLVLGIVDQVPPRFPEREAAAQRARVEHDELLSQMEAALPAGAMVFELPATEFPEVPKIERMDDYEHFKPYLHSHTLRFAYAAIKGRYESRWAKEAQQLGPEALVQLLEQYGFSALLVNRYAYPDGARALLQTYADLKKDRVLARSEEWVCLALNPSRHPILPPVFAEGWHALEGDAGENERWSDNRSKLVLENATSRAQLLRLSFGLKANRLTAVSIRRDNEILYRTTLHPHERAAPADLQLSLAPGKNYIYFETDQAPLKTGKAMESKGIFAITGFAFAR